MTKTEALNKSAQDAGFPKFDKTLFKHFEKNEVELENIIRRAMDIYVSKWISVEDILPENSDGGNQFINVIGCDKYSTGEMLFNPVLKQFQSLNFRELKDVTHWQPLPTAP